MSDKDNVTAFSMDPKNPLGRCLVLTARAISDLGPEIEEDFLRSLARQIETHCEPTTVERVHGEILRSFQMSLAKEFRLYRLESEQ